VPPTSNRESRRRRVLAGLLLALAALVAYLALWPVPVQPVAWKTGPPPGYAGPHAVNQRLSGLQRMDLGPNETGPEHVAIGPDGRLYSALASGRIMAMQADGRGRSVVADTGGRVLGFAWDAAGRLIAADAMRGLLAITGEGAQAQVQVLADKVGDQPIRYADAVVVARNGVMYFSDASTRFGAAQWGGTFEASVLDILEQSATGRLLAHDPVSGRTWVVAQGLSFANGVALSADEQSALVVETGQYRVWRIDVSATGLDVRSGSRQARVVLDNLPGYPDNLMRGAQGRIWLGFAKPRNAMVDAMAGQPWLRQVTLRLPRALWPIPPSYGHVMAFSEDGQVLADLQDPSGAYPESTGVTETAERLYIHSLHAPYLGWMPNPFTVATQR
jgi:YD repeat-containing protein